MMVLAMLARARPVLALMAVFLLAPNGATAQAANPSPSPCALLPAAAVEAVLGEPLATPPFRSSGTTPTADGGNCRYETASFRAITLNVEWTDGGTSFGAMNMMSGIAEGAGVKGAVELSDGTTLHGEWDEARQFMCCTFFALRGEQLVSIDVSGSRATVTQAAGLADLAVQNLDRPATTDDAAAVQASIAHQALRPQMVPVCDLLDRAEVEGILGAPLTANPVGDEQVCTYAWTMSDGSYDATIDLQVSWSDGFSGLRMTRGALGKAMAFIDPAGHLDAADRTSGAGGLDEMETTIIGVMGVRKDVMLSVETGGMNNEIAQTLIAAAAAKL